MSWENPKLDWLTNPVNPTSVDMNRIEGDIAFLNTDIETKKGTIVDALNGVGIATTISDTHATIASKIVAAEKTGVSITPSAINQAIPNGIFDTGGGVVVGDPDLISSNIRYNIDLFGVVGNLNEMYNYLMSPTANEIAIIVANFASVVSNLRRMSIIGRDSAVVPTIFQDASRIAAFLKSLYITTCGFWADNLSSKALWNSGSPATSGTGIVRYVDGAGYSGGSALEVTANNTYPSTYAASFILNVDLTGVNTIKFRYIAATNLTSRTKEFYVNNVLVMDTVSLDSMNWEEKTYNVSALSGVIPLKWRVAGNQSDGWGMKVSDIILL